MSFERTPLVTAEIDDLDQEALESFIKQRAPASIRDRGSELVALKLGLLARSGSRVVPTVAAMLLFGKLPQLLHPEWGVSALRVAGLLLSDPLAARADLEGNIPSLLEQSLAFVRDHSRTAADQVTLNDVAGEYSETAVREALLNALLHRDLRKTGRVAVRMFNDRLEVWSPGGPTDAAGDLEELCQEGGVSMPRNGLLAAIARAMGLGDQVGRGLPIMRRAVADISQQRFEIRTSSRDVLVVIPSRLQHSGHLAS